jgi:hypothetical protein
MAVNYDSYLVARQNIMDAVSIVDYYMDYVDESKNLEQYNRDCCPMHDESSPSFFYIEERNMFHCFGCGKGGGVTELHYHIQKRLDDNYSKARSIMDLAKMYNIKIPSLFKEVGFDDIQKLGKTSSTKLKFKRPDELIKPRKKTEYDLEKNILRLKDVLDPSELKELLDDLDEIFFVNGEVDNKLKELEEKMSRFIGGEN